MFPAGFWSRERVRRLALQLEGERWASACPPLTPRSRSARTNPLATDEPFAVLYMLAPCLAFYFTYGILPRRGSHICRLRTDRQASRARSVPSLRDYLGDQRCSARAWGDGSTQGRRRSTLRLEPASTACAGPGPLLPALRVAFCLTRFTRCAVRWTSRRKSYPWGAPHRAA